MASLLLLLVKARIRLFDLLFTSARCAYAERKHAREDLPGDVEERAAKVRRGYVPPCLSENRLIRNRRVLAEMAIPTPARAVVRVLPPLLLLLLPRRRWEQQPRVDQTATARAALALASRDSAARRMAGSGVCLGRVPPWTHLQSNSVVAML